MESMSWSSTKQLTIISSIIALFLILISGPIALWLYEPATCFDGKQNGKEVGVDCGGTCALLCPTQVRDIKVLWARTFKVAEGRYNAVAYVENPNPNATSAIVPYVFRLLDKNNIEVTSREGTFQFVNQGIFAIFETSIDTGKRDAAKAFFEWKAPFAWVKATSPDVPKVIRQALVDTGSPTRIEATIANETAYDMKDLDIVATVFDTEGNAIASSRTILPLLPKRSNKDVFFTWPTPFTSTPARIDVIPRVPPTF